MESAPPSQPTPERRTAWLAAYGLVLACVAVAHAPALGGGFVWDDIILLRDRVALHRLETAWTRAFADFFPVQGGIGAGGGYFRPVPVLLNALTWQCTDGAAWAFRISNLGLHLACVGLLMALLRRWGSPALGAALGGAFFGLHPTTTDAVDFISGRTDVLATFFVLLAFHGATAKSGASRRGQWAAATAFLLALGSKEVALGALPALVLSAPPGARRSVALSLGGVALGMIALRMGADIAAPQRAFFSTDALPVVVPGLVTFYAGLLVAPTLLQAIYTLPDLSSLGMATLVGLGLLCAWAIGMIRWQGRARLGLVLALGALAPALHFIPLSTLAAPRYLYMPLLGVAVLIALAAERLPGRWPRALVLLPAVGLLLTPLRAADWRSERTLWTAELDVEPGSFTAHQNLGATLAEEGDLDGAAYHLREAARLRPEHALIRRNLQRLEALKARRTESDPTPEGRPPQKSVP